MPEEKYDLESLKAEMGGTYENVTFYSKSIRGVNMKKPVSEYFSEMIHPLKQIYLLVYAIYIMIFIIN